MAWTVEYKREYGRRYYAQNAERLREQARKRYVKAAPRATLDGRFWAKVDQTGECWEWMAARYSNGYGAFYKGGGKKAKVMILAHRMAYELVKGPIPPGLVIDHLCRNPACVRPDHLEAVPQLVNMLRAPTHWMGAQVVATYCPKGHEYTPENTILWKGKRKCRTCRRAYDARRGAGKKRELYKALRRAGANAVRSE